MLFQNWYKFDAYKICGLDEERMGSIYKKNRAMDG